MIDLTVAAEVASIVRPEWFVAGPLVVRMDEARLDAPLKAAADGMRRRSEPLDVINAVRGMYRRFGLDPTKTRPSSEALLRRVRKGGELPRINALVDIVNWTSLEWQLPFGLYDVAAIQGDVTLRLGRAGEEYAGIRKDTVHVAERPTLADDAGPFGNPTSDSARTMVTPAAVGALVVIFCPVSVEASHAASALGATRARIADYCAAER